MSAAEYAEFLQRLEPQEPRCAACHEAGNLIAVRHGSHWQDLMHEGCAARLQVSPLEAVQRELSAIREQNNLEIGEDL